VLVTPGRSSKLSFFEVYDPPHAPLSNILLDHPYSASYNFRLPNPNVVYQAIIQPIIGLAQPHNSPEKPPIHLTTARSLWGRGGGRAHEKARHTAG